MDWTPEGKRAYHRAYWAANKDRINAAKRIRYYTDQEYRKAELERKAKTRVHHPVVRLRDEFGRFTKITK